MTPGTPWYPKKERHRQMALEPPQDPVQVLRMAPDKGASTSKKMRFFTFVGEVSAASAWLVWLNNIEGDSCFFPLFFFLFFLVVP